MIEAGGRNNGGAAPDDVEAEPPPQAPGGPARPRRHLGLAARVTTTFALGALVLSGALASITYFSVRSSLVNQEEASLAREAIANAEAVKGEIGTPGLSPSTAPGTESIFERAGRWYPSSQTVQESEIPPALRRLVLAGRAGEQLVDLGGAPVLIVGLAFRVAAGRVAYFQLFNLGEVAGALRTLLGALVVAAVVTAVGGAVVGRWAANRALRPLRRITRAALSIAGGQLDTRLESDTYADLAVLTASFNRMADRLQERIEREVRFTSDVNHELRSPLTTVATSLSVLEARREELPERARKALDLLSAEVRRFRRLVDDLLEISRLDAGLGEVNSEEVSLGQLVEHTVAATRHEVVVEVPEAVAGRRVVVDKLRFERIIANLLENAARYAGGATRVVAEADGRWGRVAVEDRGPGIPAEERERIFDRFSRGTTGRRRGVGEGTGLGLAIVAEHARLLGGRVWVEPNGAEGSRFVVEVPLLPLPSEPAAGTGATASAGVLRHRPLSRRTAEGVSFPALPHRERAAGDAGAPAEASASAKASASPDAERAPLPQRADR